MALVLILTYCDEKYQLEYVEELLSAPKLIMCALAVLIFISILFKKTNSKMYFTRIIQMISKESFGIYIYHMFWINIIYKVFKLICLHMDF